MDIDLEQIRKTGSEYFPDVAAEFRRVGESIGGISLDAELAGNISDGPDQGEIQGAFNDFTALLSRAMTTSADHLEDCGECLLYVASQYGEMDEKTAEEIFRPSSGFEEDAFNKPESTPDAEPNDPEPSS